MGCKGESGGGVGGMGGSMRPGAAGSLPAPVQPHRQQGLTGSTGPPSLPQRWGSLTRAEHPSPPFPP